MGAYLVRMNGVVTGTIPADEYHRLRDSVLRDGMIHVRQAINIIDGFFFVAVQVLVRLLPVLAFWCGLLLFVWWPETWQKIVSFAQHDRSAFVRWLLMIAEATYFLYLILLVTLGRFPPMPFRNIFGEEINRAIRYRLNISSTGKITVVKHSPKKDGDSVFGLPQSLAALNCIAWGIVLLVTGNILMFAGLPFGHLAMHYFYRNGKLNINQSFRRRGEGEA
jgi:hypothetical protein